MTTIRIGRPPQPPQRTRQAMAVRVLHHCARLAIGWGLTASGCYWLGVYGDGPLFLALVALAAMASAPRWTHRRPARPAMGGLRNAGHQLRRVWRSRRPMPSLRLPPWAGEGGPPRFRAGRNP
jgi:hypothetical protein